MYAVHLLKSSKPLVEILKHSGTFVIVSAEYACCPRFVQYAFMQAFKTFEQGQATAKTLNLEWLCKLALTTNVSNAVNFTKPSGKEICIAAMNCFEMSAELEKIGEKIEVNKEFRQKAEQILKEKYAVPAKALETYKLEDLLIEKAAVENI